MTHQKKTRYIQILKEDRAVNPPYLTGSGCVVLATLFVLAVAACAFFVMQLHDMVVCIAALSACILAGLALDYAWSLLTWRAFRQKLIDLKVAIGTDHPVAGRHFGVRLELSNRLPWQIFVEALCWDSTAHIRIADNLAGMHALDAGARYSVSFKADALRFGSGKLLGVALLMTDRFGLFRYEVHVELNIPVRVFPGRVSAKRASGFLAQSGIGRRGRSARVSEEIDGVRPFMNGDRLKRIAWRGFAKHQELVSFRQARLAHRRAVCLVDAGPHMRVFGADAPCGLMRVYAWLASLAGAFDELSILAFDENGADWIVREVHPRKAVSQLENWLFARLECSPGRNWSENEWEAAVNALYHDFKIYRRVDFSKQSKGRRMIDLAGLLAYARASWAEEMLENQQPEAASQAISMSYENALTRLIRQRCDIGEDTLSPDPPAPRLDKAWQTLMPYLATHPDMPVLWFSCYTAGASETLLREMTGWLAGKHDLACLAMPMPVFALNFSKRGGEYQRELYQQNLGRCAKFFTV
ncbi:MAG: DUF58 domain-containing protein [Proteobacteria bacterium]|nr:DUF58 domain-containing protein [Pseudomonadota bacterium]